MFTQLKSSINGMDLPDDIKSKIVGLVSNVETTSNERFDDVKNSRDTEKSKRQALQEKLTQVGSTLKLEGEFSVDDVKNILDSSDKNADIEKIKADFDTRYNTDIKVVNDKLLAKDGEYNELSEKHIKAMFTNEVQNSGLLTSFVDEPMARDNILKLIGDKTIQEDGKI